MRRLNTDEGELLMLKPRYLANTISNYGGKFGSSAYLLADKPPSEQYLWKSLYLNCDIPAFGICGIASLSSPAFTYVVSAKR